MITYQVSCLAPRRRASRNSGFAASRSRGSWLVCWWVSPRSTTSTSGVTASHSWTLPGGSWSWAGPESGPCGGECWSALQASQRQECIIFFLLINYKIILLRHKHVAVYIIEPIEPKNYVSCDLLSKYEREIRLFNGFLYCQWQSRININNFSYIRVLFFLSQNKRFIFYYIWWNSAIFYFLWVFQTKNTLQKISIVSVVWFPWRLV